MSDAAKTKQIRQDGRCARRDRWRILLYGLGGLLLTPVLTFTLGALFFGQRSTWNIGQGESFQVFLVAIYAAPFGALLWAGVGTLRACFRRPSVRRTAAAGILYVAGLIAALLTLVR